MHVEHYLNYSCLNSNQKPADNYGCSYSTHIYISTQSMLSTYTLTTPPKHTLYHTYTRTTHTNTK